MSFEVLATSSHDLQPIPSRLSDTLARLRRGDRKSENCKCGTGSQMDSQSLLCKQPFVSAIRARIATNMSWLGESNDTWNQAYRRWVAGEKPEADKGVLEWQSSVFFTSRAAIHAASAQVSLRNLWESLYQEGCKTPKPNTKAKPNPQNQSKTDQQKHKVNLNVHA